MQGRAASGMWGRTAAGPRWFVVCLINPNISLHRARPAELPPALCLDWGGRRVAGLVRNPLWELSPKPQENPCILARSHRGRVKEGKNMAISIAAEPSTERSVASYTGGTSLAPTHPRPISHHSAEQCVCLTTGRRARPPAGRCSARPSPSSSRWSCAVPASRLFESLMCLGWRIRQRIRVAAGVPLRGCAHGPVSAQERALRSRPRA